MLLGYGRDGLDYLMYGDNDHKPAEKIERERGAAVLAYWPSLPDFPNLARIDPTGTRRRVQALQMLGFNHAFVAGRAGVPFRGMSRALTSERVTAQFARAILRAYNELWNQNPEDLGILPWVADRTRRAAAVGGFVGPLAWDDDTIDDPGAEPLLDAGDDTETYDEVAVRRYADGTRINLTASERLAAIALCVSRGMSFADIDREHGHGSSFTCVFVGRMRRAYEREGRPFPEALVQDGSRELVGSEVVEIRTRSFEGETDLELGMAFGVRARVIAEVCRGRTYQQYGGPIREPKQGPTPTSKTLFAGKTGQRAA
ncbi:hypothetical protein [Streptomyces sp. NPDC015130]|uniref:hypothetical protein n=1 Tax=Streptomyces sp. NPDC015130 TaxID=3364940 RepID=UPI0037023FA2